MMLPRKREMYYNREMIGLHHYGTSIRGGPVFYTYFNAASKQSFKFFGNKHDPRFGIRKVNLQDANMFPACYLRLTCMICIHVNCNVFCFFIIFSPRGLKVL